MTAIAKLAVADALKQWSDQCCGGKDNKADLRALKGFIEEVVAEECKKDLIRKTVKDPRAIKLVTEKALSRETLIRPYKRLVASQVSNAIKDITIENPNYVCHRSLPLSFRLSSYATSDNDLIRNSSPTRCRRKNTWSKNKRKALEGSGVGERRSDGTVRLKRYYKIGHVFGQNRQQIEKEAGWRGQNYLCI